MQAYQAAVPRPSLRCTRCDGPWLSLLVCLNIAVTWYFRNHLIYLVYCALCESTRCVCVWLRHCPRDARDSGPSYLWYHFAGRPVPRSADRRSSLVVGAVRDVTPKSVFLSFLPSGVALFSPPPQSYKHSLGMPRVACLATWCRNGGSGCLLDSISTASGSAAVVAVRPGQCRDCILKIK